MSVDPSVHRRLAVEANNSVWEILGKPMGEISEDEAEEMTRRAYTAAYHWQRAEGATTANEARASWLLSRVWVIRNNGSVALQHARKCLAVCESSGLVDFDLAYAHESLARSYACLGDTPQAWQHLLTARGVSVIDPDDRDLVNTDLVAEPWFGLNVLSN